MSRTLLKLAYGPLALLLLVMTLLNVATANELEIRADQCTSGDVQCCNIISASTDTLVGAILNEVGIVLSGVAEIVGITCVPINLFGLTQAPVCQNKPLCCSNKNVKGPLGLIAIGCVPININA